MSKFKDMLYKDIKKTFMNPQEFGELHSINGQEIMAIIDNNEMLEREKRYQKETEGIYRKQLMIYVTAEELGPPPAIGRLFSVDRKDYSVMDVINEDGIYSILLEANRSTWK